MSLQSPEPLPPRFAAFVADLALRPPPPGTSRYPGLTSQPWHDPTTIPLACALEAAASAILPELRAVMDADFAAEHENIVRRGRWEVAFFYQRGRRNDALVDRCPATRAAIENARSIRTQSGLAYLSRLAASSRVAPHRGPTNLRLRCHFGVDIPDECGITVGGQTRTWIEGRCIVFDDSFEHEAWNRDVRDRIVLIVDVWHPELSDEEVRLLEGLDSYIESRALNLERYYRSGDRPQ